MKNLVSYLWLLPALWLMACVPAPPIAVVEPTPTPTPAPTPHPATGAAEAATSLYPDLSKINTTFNRTFRDLYEEQLRDNPNALARADWPLVLARRTASILGVAAVYPDQSTPTPTPAPATPTPTWFEQRMQEKRSLDGAYDVKRGVTRPPSYYNGRTYYYDQYGRRVYY